MGIGPAMSTFCSKMYGAQAASLPIRSTGHTFLPSLRTSVFSTCARVAELDFKVALRSRAMPASLSSPRYTPCVTSAVIATPNFGVTWPSSSSRTPELTAMPSSDSATSLSVEASASYLRATLMPKRRSTARHEPPPMRMTHGVLGSIHSGSPSKHDLGSHS